MSEARVHHLVAVVACLITLGSATAEAQRCFPACRSGYVCYRQQCVSACNPPCPAGQQCLDGGRCVGVGTPWAMTPGPTTMAYAPQVRPIALRSPGWATAAGIWGIANAVISLGAGTSTFFIEDEAARGAVALSAVGYLGVATPFVVVGGNSSTGRSVTGLEVMGWITYGLGMTGGLVLSMLHINNAGPDREASYYYYVPFGLLSLANALFAGDAFVSASRATTYAAATLTPRVAFAPDGAGGMAVRVGLGGVF